MKLKKIGENYWLQDGIIFIACSDKEKVFGDLKYLLDKSKIESLFKPDLDKIATERFWKWNGKQFEDHEITNLEKEQYVHGFGIGYNQCLEDNSEKKFTEKDLYNILLDFIAFPHDHNEPRGKIIERFIPKINSGFHYKEQTEWDVEVEMERAFNLEQHVLDYPPKQIKITDGFINILKIKS